MNPAAVSEVVVHVSPRVQARGGIETLHHYHRRLAGRQVFVALFDRAPAPREDYHNLDCTWRTSLRAMRRRFATVLARYPGAVVAYHNGWGLSLFHDLDRAARRVVFLHADPAYHAPDLRGFVGRVDGACAISPGQRPAWQAWFPTWEERRLTIFPVPIRAGIPARGDERARGDPIVLGYAGRLERGDKRVDLLPSLLAALAARGVRYRFEILGAGSLGSWLRSETAGRPVHFHGWTDDETYRRVQAGWDAAVYFSEHDGGPIALLEAMSSGAIPFFPRRGGSWADLYVPQVDARGHYAPGDMTALAGAIEAVFQEPVDALRSRRREARRLVAGHTPERYIAACDALLATVRQLPRVSAEHQRPARAVDLLPLGVVTRLWPGLLRS